MSRRGARRLRNLPQLPGWYLFIKSSMRLQNDRHGFLAPDCNATHFIDIQLGQQASDRFFARTATFLTDNNGLSYATLAQITAEMIVRIATPFADTPVRDNLIRLRTGEGVGQWRDSGNGLGGERTPYDVNPALSIHPDWKDSAARFAQGWEDKTLRFFEVTVPQADAKSRVQSYVTSAGISVPANADSIAGDVKFYGLAIDGTINSGDAVPVTNTDDCFRYFFLNTTNQTQISMFIEQAADHTTAFGILLTLIVRD
ncbi:hypothetical protein BDU57DRAFT_536180 [Ampelomyces quisqualis]|uniref:Uncharacterized protein n=1 Tax=Ampelomyces quisqualis TaxID=50730 RepID=A0A6A5QUX3_AMPQU|nr:hypothetical protein BDU57DRAFT_536180 [Ampelomyces quisqualis]